MAADTIQHREGGRRTQGHVRTKEPLVSIITVTFSAKDDLERILKNVFEFDASEFELIVIDGGSADGTVEILEQWNQKIEYWLSESDTGIYDAMNKARGLARGRFLYHLNAGDSLVYLPTKELETAILDNVDIATFPVSIDGNRKFYPSNSWKLRIKNTFHHQGTFYRRETLPAYDPSYKVYADFDLNQRAVLSGSKVQIFDTVVAVHSTAGISNTAAIAESEHYRIIRKNHGLRYLAVSWIQRKWDGVMVRLGRVSEKF